MIRSAPTNIVKTFAIASVIGLLLVSPFAFLELRYAAAARQSSDYAALFGLMWLLTVAIVMVGAATARKFKSGPTVPSTLGVLGVVFLLVFLAGIWITIVRDQFPCFVGVSNCD